MNKKVCEWWCQKQMNYEQTIWIVQRNKEIFFYFKWTISIVWTNFIKQTNIDKINNVLEQPFKTTIGFILNKQFFQQIFEKNDLFFNSINNFN